MYVQPALIYSAQPVFVVPGGDWESASYGVPRVAYPGLTAS